MEDPSAFGVVPTRADGQVIAFVEKPAPGKAPSTWINAGTYVLEPQFLDRIPPRLKVSIERETFPRVLVQPGLLFGYQSDAYWLDIGTPEKYLEAHADVLAGRVGIPPAPGAHEASDGVWVQGHVTIDPGADVVAPVLFADGAHIEAGARVVASVLGPGAVVESRADIDHAVLHGRCPRVAREPGARLRRRHRLGAETRGRAHRPHDRRVGCHGRVGHAHLRRAGAARTVGGIDMTSPLAMVTGGAGFIGSTLVDRLLAESWRVDVVDDLSSGSLGNLADARSQEDRKFSFHRLDVSSPAMIDLVTHRRPDVVFHLAAQPDVRVSVARPTFDAAVNILGTLNVCEGARRRRREEGRVRRVGRHAVRHAGRDPRARGSPAAPRVALRCCEEGRERLPALLPHDSRTRVHRARARQRVRPAPRPAR